jgi:hypothetical protein
MTVGINNSAPGKVDGRNGGLTAALVLGSSGKRGGVRHDYRVFNLSVRIEKRYDGNGRELSSE